VTEIEYEIIDELYFVTSYHDIGTTLILSDEELCTSLKDLLARGYIKAYYPDQDTEIPFDETHFGKYCQDYYFLATKAGLIVHNSR
jgi:hypothetical protein